MREIDYTRLGSDTPSKYRFVLSFVLHSEIGNLELKHAPLEWPDIELLMRRDKEMHGVHITAVVESVTFIKEGADLLKELYASKGLFSECSMYIYYLDHSTRTYVSLPTAYRLDFNTYKEVKLTKGINGVNISAIEDGTVSKFQQRKNTAVNLNNLKGLSGFTIADYSSLKKTVNLPEMTIFKVVQYANAATNNYTSSTHGTAYNYLPLTINGSDFIEAKSVVYYSGASLDRTKGLFVENETERTVHITGTVNFTINSIAGATSRMTISLLVLNIDNTLYATLDAQAFDENDSGAQTATIDETYTLPVDKTIILVGVALVGNEGGATVNVDFTGSDIDLRETISTAPASSVEGMPIYEALNRNLQIILDQQYPLYSEFFGRTDTIYNADDDVYLTENQLRFASVLSGLNVRGWPLTMAEMPMKFTDLFKSIKAIWAVGGGFEFVDSVLKFRIEELAHFYQETEILDLTGRVNQFEIEREQDGEAMFSNLKSGFSKFDYESISGRGEYNTTSQRTTVVPNDTEFNNVSPLRADTRGILALRLKPIETTGSEDTQSDSDVFLIKTQSGYDWDAETTENITAFTGSLFQTGSLNLYFTPTRNLIRHGAEINAGLGLMPGTELTYQYAEKNSALETTGEGYTIAENDDILASDLADPLWYPEILTVEVPFYEADYVAVTDNPHGYITLSDIYSGWIIDLRYKFAQNLATITLKRRITP